MSTYKLYEKCRGQNLFFENKIMDIWGIAPYKHHYTEMVSKINNH